MTCSPHNSRGDLSSGQAIAALHLDRYRDLVIAMSDAGHPLPRPSDEEVESQLATALPLLQAVLVPEPRP